MINQNDSISQRQSDAGGDAKVNKTSTENLPRKSQIRENIYSDDLIVTLANAYENKRARQVSEWERAQRIRRAYL